MSTRTPAGEPDAPHLATCPQCRQQTQVFGSTKKYQCQCGAAVVVRRAEKVGTKSLTAEATDGADSRDGMHLAL